MSDGVCTRYPIYLGLERITNLGFFLSSDREYDRQNTALELVSRIRYTITVNSRFLMRDVLQF
jgi:hypothetical protein